MMLPAATGGSAQHVIWLIGLKLRSPHRHGPAHCLVADVVKRLSLRQLCDGVLNERLLRVHGPHDRLILELLKVPIVEQSQRGPHTLWQGLHWHAGGRNQLSTL